MAKTFKSKLNLVFLAVFVFSILFNIFYSSVSQAVVPPSIGSIQVSPSTVSQGRETSVSISCRATSVYGISSVSADIFDLSDMKMATVTLYDDGLHGDSGNRDEVFAGEYTAPATLSIGKYYITVKAVDGMAVTNSKDKTVYFEVTSAQIMQSAAASTVTLLFENFDSASASYLPANWRESDWNTYSLDYGDWEVKNYPYRYKSAVQYIKGYALSGTDIYHSQVLYTPQYSYNSSYTYNINFYAGVSAGTCSLQVGTVAGVTSGSSGSNFTSFASYTISNIIPNGSPSSYQLKQIGPVTIPAGQQHITFLLYNCTGEFYLDDVTVLENR